MPGKSRRRAARDAALQVLYEIEVGKQTGEDAINHVLKETDLDREAADFMRELVLGALEKREEIDARLESLSHDWALMRQACIDRNVMRIAAYELLYCPTIPPAATINEAVELVKKYSTADSSRFVNGVLGALADGLSVEEPV